MQVCGKKINNLFKTVLTKNIFRHQLLSFEKNRGDSIVASHCFKIAKGIPPLNDISRQINTAVSFQKIMFIVEVVLLAINTIMGYYKYYQINSRTTKWHLFMAITTHVSIIGQCIINDSSSRHVSCLCHIFDQMISKCKFFRREKFLQQCGKSQTDV